MQLHEKYRPKTLDGVIGQEKAVQVIRRIVNNDSIGGRAFWFTGQSGTGKTTIAKIMVDHFCRDWDIIETVGRGLCPNRLKEIMYNWMFIGGHALIVNEAHGLNKPIIELFLNVLESLPANVIVIFTTTNDGADLFEEQMDSSPFKSRCLSIRLVSRGLCEPFAQKAHEIACQEGLNGRPIDDYIKLMKQCRNNLREALSRIEAGEMLN
jgi:replication-associated recombination protein RarA